MKSGTPNATPAAPEAARSARRCAAAPPAADTAVSAARGRRERWRVVLHGACLAVLLGLGGCGRLALPQLSGEPDAEADVDRTTTPRDLLGARLVNPRSDPDMPNLTVGKLIEFADRYLACDCATTRFVNRWEPTAEGYRLLTNSEVVRPLEFVCRGEAAARECYLTEIDRGRSTEDFAERFVPGAEFIRFMYEQGVRCERETPCP